VGKTRLLDELTARATGRGVRVLTGHCVDLGDVGLPYLPFVDLFRPVAAEPELAPAAAGNPVLAALLAGRPASHPCSPPPRGGTSVGRCRTGPRPNRWTTAGSSSSSRWPGSSASWRRRDRC